MSLPGSPGGFVGSTTLTLPLATEAWSMQPSSSEWSKQLTSSSQWRLPSMQKPLLQRQTSRDGLKAIGGGVLRGALTRSRELRADMPLASLRRQSHHVQQHHHQHDRVYYGGDDGHEVEGPSGLRGALRDGHIAHRGQDGCGQQVHHRVAYMPMVSYVHDEVQQEEDYQPDDRTSQPLHRLLLLRISNLEAQDGMAVRHEGLV
eukprot:CAMPEP_0175210782 /NCGR_PEP_ID=MMETSP0093-20121207/14822_1 /TAXON_ID=311494 /ORGANISM="Alexandrium monilatum, Strain CCMP3105" /LENGTH=202 /DNA_ID=CAMNT_0016504021 /DNA_START=297 /DNA_END=901 /DNA_ORIENTATION=-